MTRACDLKLDEGNVVGFVELRLSITEQSHIRSQRRRDAQGREIKEQQRLGDMLNIDRRMKGHSS